LEVAVGLDSELMPAFVGLGESAADRGGKGSKGGLDVPVELVEELVG
jgi:hypothetical protein